MAKVSKRTNNSSERLGRRLRQQPECTKVTSWAIGRIEKSSLIAIQINDENPFLLDLATAFELGTAIANEVDTFGELDGEKPSQ